MGQAMEGESKAEKHYSSNHTIINRFELVKKQSTYGIETAKNFEASKRLKQNALIYVLNVSVFQSQCQEQIMYISHRATK